MAGTAIASIIQAPTILSLEGETLQIQENTLIGTKSPPTSVYRAWVARYYDLAEIDSLNRVLAYKGVNMDGETMLWKLARCESGHNPAVKVLDTNNKISYYLFQIQEETFKLYGGEDIENLKQHFEVAIKIMLSGKGHTPSGWMNCWRIENLPII